MTLFFYDLETSSGSARTGRIMQFAGQRTNEALEPIGDPVNVLVALSDDCIPEPDAILVHGITPQQANQEGLSEADFAEFFHDKIATSGTTFVGFNNIRFDDEFMRLVSYRNFHDPYEWHWKDNRSRWDLMDPIRMMRALRPDGIEWPFMPDGAPTVKLELLAKQNKLLHTKAHDALSDVEALIGLARLFQEAQPKLFEYLYSHRDKKLLEKFETSEQFVYTSGKYSSENEKTTVVAPLFRHPRRGALLVYDLRYDPSEWLDKSPKELANHWKPAYGSDTVPLPVKTMQYNRCPAVAPIQVLDKKSIERIHYDKIMFDQHLKTLHDNSHVFIEKIEETLDIVEKEQQQALFQNDHVDNQLYDGFWSEKDTREMREIRMADPKTFSELQTKISNSRLRELMPLYKARNFPKLLTPEERRTWDEYRLERVFSDSPSSPLQKVSKRMLQLMNDTGLSEHKKYLLEELKLYIESIHPSAEWE